MNTAAKAFRTHLMPRQIFDKGEEKERNEKKKQYHEPDKKQNKKQNLNRWSSR